MSEITKIKTANHEEWLSVPGFEGLYEISNRGEVKSLNFHREKKEHLLKQYVDRYGYMKVVLYKNGKPHFLTVHRLVALAFLPNRGNKKTVDHIDCNRTNNHVENLRWATMGENLSNSHKLGRQAINATPIIGVNPEGKQLYFDSQREAERASGVRQYEISRSLHGQKVDLKGWCFSYGN